MSQLPWSLGRFWGRRPLVRSTIARRQEATDPQSPEGGSQRACHHGGCPPHGFWASRGVALLKQSALVWQLSPLSLWDASPGVLSQPPFPPDRSLGRRLIAEVTLFQRGTASDKSLDQTLQFDTAGVHP